MQERKRNAMSEKYPFASACFKTLINIYDEIEDLLIIDSNQNFEEITGFTDIRGRKLKELLKKESKGFDMISYFVDEFKEKKIMKSAQRIKVKDVDYELTIIPSAGDYLFIVLHKICESHEKHSDMKNSEALLENLRPVLNSTHDAISLVEYTANGFQYVGNNILHQEITGIKNIKGLSPIELLGEEVGKKLIRYYEECMKTGSVVSYEQKFNFAPGDHVWQTEVTPVFGSEGIRYLLCSSKDITELKHILDEKEMLTIRLQSMFDNHAAAMLLLNPENGKIIDANPSACNFYGYTKEELQRMSISDINMLTAEEIEMHRRMAFEKKQHFYIFPHRLKNGEIRLVDVYSSPISDGKNALLYSIIFDVTDRENYKKTLSQEKEILETTLKSIGDGVVTTDECGYITSLNPVAEAITGWEENDAIGKKFTVVFILENEDTGLPVDNPVYEVLETGRIQGLAQHTVLINRQKKKIPIADSAAPILSENGSLLGVVLVFRDVSDEKKHNKQIEYLSYHDALTGLYNRRFVDEIMKRIDINENLPITIVMGDVNGLKITNDIFGHENGDLLLKEMARSLQFYFRSDDIIARWGGDEVIIIMLKTQQETAEKIIKKMNSSNIIVEESSLQLSISLGYATKERMDENIQFVMKTAEESMYHQKLLQGKSYRSSVINSLLATLYEKSHETEEHSKRMEHYCFCVGKAMKLSLKEMNEMSLLSRLHDIGKVSINANILRKPGVLTQEEWEEVKRHSEIGYRIAQATPELATIADYILSHHERWDGKGYPRGLRANEIPIPCRIFAIADSYDAMTNNRCYRKAFSKEKAIKEIEMNAGSQFDPEIAQVFVDVLINETNSNRND